MKRWTITLPVFTSGNVRESQVYYLWRDAILTLRTGALIVAWKCDQVYYDDDVKAGFVVVSVGVV